MKLVGKKLLSMYYDLKESGSTSDFPLLLANVMHKILLSKFKGVRSPWAQYTFGTTLTDFRTADRVIMDESPDLLEVEEDGNYVDSELGDNNYQNQLKTYGRTFSIGRRAIINDDMNVLRQTPARFGRAAARTLAKKIVFALEGHGNTYDGAAMFAAAHSNSANVALANTVAGIDAVSAGVLAIENSTDETGEKMGITAKFLLVPTDLEDVALRIVKGTDILPVNTTGGTRATGKAQRLTVLVEPFLTSATGWYLFADPNDAPAIEIGFLNGKSTPDLLVKRADTVRVAGGDDEWGFEFDQIFFKVRHDWATAKAMYQGVYQGND